MFSPEIPHKNQFPNQNPRKIQFMRNLAPIERPETSINENIVRKTENTTKKEYF